MESGYITINIGTKYLLTLLADELLAGLYGLFVYLYTRFCCCLFLLFSRIIFLSFSGIFMRLLLFHLLESAFVDGCDGTGEAEGQLPVLNSERGRRAFR